MKLWIRMVVGTAVGLIVGAYLPVSPGDTLEFMETLAGLAVNLGRYAALPLLFFGVIIAIHELRETRTTLKVYGLAAAATVSVSLVTVLFGTLITLLLAPRRIPPIFQEAFVPRIPNAAALFREVFPRNLFAVFADTGDFLLPLMVLAILIGLVLFHERTSVSPAIDLIDSLARVFYRLNAWILEALSVGLIAISAAWLMRLRAVPDLQLFAPLIWVVTGLAAFFVLIVIPGLVYLMGDRQNPLNWLYAMVAPTFVAFMSGDSYFAFGTVTRVAKENLGVSREAAAPILSLTTLFAKSGSAMVVAATFITLLRSYTALEIGFGQVLWIIGGSFLISFVLGRAPGATVIVGISLLANAYGQGMEGIFLILLPALPILTGIAVVVDTMTSTAITFITALRLRKRRIVDPMDFV